MQEYRRAFPWPLLLILQQQSTWAALRVSVPSSPIRALPFSDVWLPCNFSDPLRSIALADLDITWSRGTEVIAEYYGTFTPRRQGAEMSEEWLRLGDASLLLPRLQESESGVYTCVVISTPEKAEGSFELKLEAKPHIELGSTKVQLARECALTCMVSAFYPGDVSVGWLKNGVVMNGSQTSVQLDSQNGLYYANSTLKLTPSVADADANFSCQVRHSSLRGPLQENFQLQLQALPSLQVSTAVSRNTLLVLKCLVSGFYPRDVDVHWLRDGTPQEQVESKPQTLSDGTFRMQSLLWAKEMDHGVSYLCQVQHRAWDNPVNMTAHWQPEDEGEGVPCPTPQHPQSSGTERTPHSCSPTPVPPSPDSAIGTVAIWTWIVFGLGLIFFIGGISLYVASKKGKNKSYPDTKGKDRVNLEATEPMLKSANDRESGNTPL